MKVAEVEQGRSQVIERPRSFDEREGYLSEAAALAHSSTVDEKMEFLKDICKRVVHPAHANAAENAVRDVWRMVCPNTYKPLSRKRTVLSDEAADRRDRIRVAREGIADVLHRIGEAQVDPDQLRAALREALFSISRCYREIELVAKDRD